MAKRARAALANVDGIQNVIVDTTARVVIWPEKGKPDVKALNETLKSVNPRLKVRKLVPRRRSVAKAVYTISMKGFG